MNQSQKNIKNKMKKLIEKLGYINSNILFNELVKLSYNPPSYRIMADIVLKTIEQVNPGISSDEAWRLTTRFVNNMKSNLIINNQYFQKVLKEGLTPLSKNESEKHKNLFNSKNIKFNNYEYLEKVNIHIGKSEIYYDFVLFINSFPLVIIKIIDENNFEKEFLKLEDDFEEFPMFFNFNKLILLTDGEKCKLGSIYEFPEEYTDFIISTDYKDEYEIDTLHKIQNILDPKNILKFIKNYQKVSEMVENFKNTEPTIEIPEDSFYDDFSLEDLFKDEEFQEELSKVTYSGVADYSENIEVIAEYQANRSNRDIFDDIVLKNQALVKKIAHKYLWQTNNTCLTYDDLVSSGNIGMFRAIEKFDPSKGYQFSTYATNWIEQRISRDISNEGRMIRIPVHQVEDILKLTKLEKEMMAKEQRIDDNQLLTQMNIDQSKLNELRIDRQQFKIVSSTNVLIGDDEDSTLGQFISSENMLYSGHQAHLENPSDRVEDTIFKEELIDFLKEQLTEREFDVVIRRNGLGDNPSETLEEIGKTHAVTRERIRQIEAKAYKKLKKPIKYFINLS